METVGVVGAGTMGHGIAQVAAMAGYAVVLADVDPDAVVRALDKVRANLDKGVEKGKVEPAVRDAALGALRGGTIGDVAACDLQIEAIPEQHDLKVELFRDLQAAAPAGAIFATNTSSLSVSAMAAELERPERLIGTHFFNPVHIMKLLEVVVAERTAPDVLEAVERFGARIGKEVIVVQDAPGFATSRLGVCLGMEAIRMVEQGVASPEAIDKAMVLGYRHPVGPLRLTDLVGLDVRMHIGEYLARALGNPAFEPPELLRRMVAEGKLGKKSGEGFYRW